MENNKTYTKIQPSGVLINNGDTFGFGLHSLAYTQSSTNRELRLDCESCSSDTPVPYSIVTVYWNNNPCWNDGTALTTQEIEDIKDSFENGGSVINCEIYNKNP